MSNAASQMAQLMLQAQKMGGQPGEPGLIVPPEMKALQAMATVGQGFALGQAGAPLAQALAGQAVPALQGLGEAGAIFPEGEIPKITSLEMKKEAEDVIPQSQQDWIRNMKNYDWHSNNMDWPRVLADKWALLKNAQGN